jgi:hypothetical protein
MILMATISYACGRCPSSSVCRMPVSSSPGLGYPRQARDIAAQGYLVVIVPMPFNLAVLGRA